MARPKKCRRICHQPDYEYFVPSGIVSDDVVTLTLDEYETIRLIDYEKKTQLECAQLMNISRPSVTDIYERARFKIADSMMNGKVLHISGGHYELCDGQAQCGRYCHKENVFDGENPMEEKGEKTMRIAVTYENGKVFQHFGHTAEFKVYDVEDGKVVSSQVVSTNGQGHGALAGFLFNGQVDVLICGGIGGGAQQALANAGIQLFGGVSGDADEAVNNYLNGTLGYNPNVKCDHHDHEHGEGHTCGDHGCGNGGCHH